MLKSMTVLLIIASTMVTNRQERGGGPVWFWFATCGGPLMTLEVQVDSRLVHRATFPVCRTRRDAVQNQGQAGRVEFAWRTERVVVWDGYREATDRTSPNTNIEASIWQAGADPDAMMLGVSLVDGKKILMNTVHIAHPGARDESVIAMGVTVRTYPAK